MGSVADPDLGHCGQNMMVTIVEALVHTVSLAFQYEEPYTTAIVPKNGPTAGGYYVQVCFIPVTQGIHMCGAPALDWCMCHDVFIRVV